MASEQDRLKENASDPAEPWYDWGTYVSERQWGTVREDYGASGDSWNYLPHDHARSRAYRWGEDGLLGWSDRRGRLNFALALWNGKDPILKERLFGLTNSEGNHGEDVKELYYFIDGVPTASYMKGLYKYPISEYPYDGLVHHGRTKTDRELELVDTGIFDHGYYDVLIEYAKQDARSVAIRITVINQSNAAQELTLIPQLWFRNTWSWKPDGAHPSIWLGAAGELRTTHPELGEHTLLHEGPARGVFTRNNTNEERIFNSPNTSPYVKDAFHRFVVDGATDAVDPSSKGTKAGLIYQIKLAPHASKTIHLLLTPDLKAKLDIKKLDALFETRINEANEFYAAISPGLTAEVANVQRQAFAGLVWSKQVYHYDVNLWLKGDPLQPPPPESREHGRNSRWHHVRPDNVMSMPDTWEYPWFAAWDLAFHAVTFALIDPQFAKSQMILLEREWMMHPNGQIPAYEWAFDDVNPPVHAWAAWRIYTIERRITGKGDIDFLERMFDKLLLNFTWWVNRKDVFGDNVFEGGFLGLDNIGIFDRNKVLEDGMTLEQSDGTSWMAFFCLQMLTIALELASEDAPYIDLATKFFQHFLYIARAMNSMARGIDSLWDEEDGFFYDCIHRGDGSREYVKVRSAVGIIPLFAVMVVERDLLEQFPEFLDQMDWFLRNKPELMDFVASVTASGQNDRRLLSIISRTQLQRVLARVLDTKEFLSDFGIRALSRIYKDQPYTLQINGVTDSIDYEPAESTTGDFGGNSNWRGPIWMPLNYLLIESLQQYDYYYGSEFTIEIPTGSGEFVTLDVVAAELENRLLKIFLPDAAGQRPIHDGLPAYGQGKPWGDLVLFYEYFSGDTGRGVGASHQTGWTSLIAKIINQLYVTAYSNLVD
jgi:hypothetical protein